MKTKEELTAVKEKAEAMNEKVRKLTDEELLLCSGGTGFGRPAGNSLIALVDRLNNDCPDEVVYVLYDNHEPPGSIGQIDDNALLTFCGNRVTL